MVFNVYVPLLVSILFGAIAPAMSRRLPPVLGAWLLSAGSLVAAAMWGGALSLLAASVIAQQPLVAARGHWSGATVRALDPVAFPVGVLALVGLVIAVVRLGVALRAWVRGFVDARRLAAALPSQGGELAVVDTAATVACAVPGRPGRIVVSTGLLRLLDSRQRRAVLTHERSHLMHRHHLHRLAAQLAAAVNPFLAKLPDASALCTERWADEDAAAATERDVVAQAVAHAARHPKLAPWGARASAVLALGADHLTDRIQALREPAPTRRWWPLALTVAVLVVALAAAADATHDAHHLFEVAQALYPTHR